MPPVVLREYSSLFLLEIIYLSSHDPNHLTLKVMPIVVRHIL